MSAKRPDSEAAPLAEKTPRNPEPPPDAAPPPGGGRPPKVFDELVGQQAAVELLRTALRTSTGMTHAWLFTGPPGSGRSVAARAFAAALQCPNGGCAECSACHLVLAGTHPDVELVRPPGLSYSVKETRELVVRAAHAPAMGRWQVVLFEDADRATEQAANALLKAIEEPPPRTVWLLCTPSPDDLVVTIRSRCRLVSLRTPPRHAVADVLVQRDGIDSAMAAYAARIAQGHVGRARWLATDERARLRREEVLRIPAQLSGVSDCLSAAEQLMTAANEEAAATTSDLDATEVAELRQALGDEGSSGSRRSLPRGSAAAVRELEERQKSRATRVKRDALDRALLDLASYYRDVLVVQFRSDTPLVGTERTDEIERAALASSPEATLCRLEAIMQCRELLAANANPQLAVESMTLALRNPARTRRVPVAFRRQ